MDRFERYVEKINNLKRTNDTLDLPEYAKLKMYGLYKQSTIGDTNTAQPSIFSFVERSKWNAWNEYKGMSSSVAMKLYVDFAKLILNKLTKN